MPRLYCEFPGSYPGVGLLLLRLVSCAMLLGFEWRGMAVINAAEGHDVVKTSLAIFLFVAGGFILLGFMTTIASLLVGFVEGVWAICAAVIPTTDGFEGKWLYPVLIAGALAVVVLTGPGGFSLDAYFFGPKRVAIPIVKQTWGGAL